MLIVVIGFVLGGFHISAQNKITIVDIGGVKINIPSPNKHFIEVGEEQRPIFADFVLESSNMLCVFLDTNDIIKMLNGKTEDLKLDKFIVVQIDKDEVERDYNEDDFIEIKNNTLESITSDLKEINEKGNNILNKKLDESVSNEANEPKTLGKIKDTKESFGVLMTLKVNSNIRTMNLLSSVNLLRIRNKLISANIYCNFDDIAKIKWITDFSETWAKAILDANK